MFNNPLRYSDPTGHCAENGDEACWSYLESTFCNDGLCEPGEWERWIVAGGDSVWTIEELDLVRAALLQTKNALEANGFDWLAVLGDGWRFERFNMQRIPTFHDRTNSIYETELLPNGTSRQVLKGLQLSWYSGSKRIGLSDEAFGRPDIIGAIIHEIGHAVNYTHGGTLVSSFSSDPNFSTNVYSSSGQRNASEQWAEAFAAYIQNASAHTGDSVIAPDPGFANVSWDNINIAVHTSLTVTLNK